jgi:hypothetical protein
MLSIVGVLAAGCNNVESGTGTKAVGVAVGYGVGVEMGRNSLIRGHIGITISKAIIRIPIPTSIRRKTFPVTVFESHLVFIYQKDSPRTKNNNP